MNKHIKVVSLFSGIGGFEEGLKKTNISSEIVFSSEIDGFAQKSYIANFSEENLHGDIKVVNEKEVPDHDLLLAVFPCQSFSIAGQRKGFDEIIDETVPPRSRYIPAGRPAGERMAKIG